MKKIGKKLLSVLVGGAMLVSSAPLLAGASPAAGTPYSKGDVYRELIRAQAEDPKK